MHTYAHARILMLVVFEHGVYHVVIFYYLVY